MFKDQFKSNPGCYSVCSNRDQLKNSTLQIIVNGTMTPISEAFDWWEHMASIENESETRRKLRINRVISFHEDRTQAIELYNLLRANKLAALRNWLD